MQLSAALEKFVPSFWFVTFQTGLKYLVVSVAASVACSLASLFLFNDLVTRLIPGLVVSIVVVTLTIMLLLYRRVQLLRSSIQPAYPDEHHIRTTIAVMGEGVTRRIGWLSMTDRAFYFVPVGLLRRCRQMLVRLADIEGVDLGDEQSYPGGNVVMPVWIKMTTRKVYFLLPEANRWNTTFTIQLKQLLERRAPRAITSQRQAQTAAPASSGGRTQRRRTIW